MRKACESAANQIWAIACLVAVLLLSTATASAQSSPAVPTAKPTVTPPRAASLPGRMQAEQLFVKPGHWLASRLDVWTGDQELRGTLIGGWIGADEAPLTYPPLRYRLQTEQPAVVPKQSDRGLETLLFVPNDSDAAGRGLGTRDSRLHDGAGLFRLNNAAGFASLPEVRRPTTALRDHQSLFVVLAARPSDYAWLDTFDAINAAHSPTAFPEFDTHYRLVVVDDKTRPPLPSTVLGWTTTACLLWDGFDMAELSEEQRTALVDWIHWGGTLIVAGPGTLDLPVCEPLRSWLPTDAAVVRPFDAAALKPLQEATIAGPPLNTDRKWSGLQLVPHAAAKVTLGTREQPLVVERRLGRGRIIAAAFRPLQSELLAWPSYAGLFHNHLMRRLPRVWTLHPEARDLVTASWADDRTLPSQDEARRGAPDPWFDPGRISSLRFFGRGDMTTTSRRTLITLDRPLGPGVAAWRDDDEISAAARDAIRAASGIFIPSVAAVSWLVGGYVLIAVPLNWLVFKSLRRPQWAWAALPVLAVVYTVVIIRAAELDLGFVRSSSETTLVEIQPGYDRAHITRFTSLFNSLGTEYRLVGEDSTTVTLPFPVSLETAGLQINQPYQLVQNQDAAGRRTTTLLGTVVDSNSVAAARSEQMTPLGGTLTADVLDGGRVRIVNRTSWELRDVHVTGNGFGFLDAIPPRSTVEVKLNSEAEPPHELREIESFRNLFAAMQRPGTVYLTATTAAEITGLRVEPVPSQRRRMTIVAAVLQYAADSPPGKDANTRRQMEAQLPPAP
jgi:hypothetical protein